MRPQNGIKRGMKSKCPRLTLSMTLSISITFHTSQRAQKSRTREGEKALILGFICRPQTRYMQYFDEGLDRSFVSAFWRGICILLYKHFKRKIIDK